MKIRENKIATVTMILILATAAFMTVLPTTFGHTPPWTIPTYAYIVVSPNPVGVGETAFVVMWLHGAPPTAAGAAGDRWHDFTLEITRPDGTVEQKGPFVSDPTGSTYTLYTPSQTGTYKFVFKYSGQVLTLVNPATGVVVSRNDATLARFGGAAFENDTFLPSQATTYLTVQQTPVPKLPDYPLPSSYWTRPIEGENSAWAAVASNWLSGAYLGWLNPNQQNLWQKDGVGPGSAHVMWTRPIEFGGIVGETTEIPGIGFYSGGSYEGRFTSAMIMNGFLYYQEPLGHSNNGGGYTCVNLRTGEVQWHRDDIGVIVTAGLIGTATTTSTIQTAGPTFGQLYNYESPNQHGVVGGLLWQSSAVGANTTWQAFDAFTGKWAYNLTNVPAGFEVYTKKGEIVRYVLNYNTTRRGGWLGLWNNTAEQQGLHALKGTVSEAWQWRPNGKSVDMSQAYTWNVTVPDLSGLSPPSIISVIPGDVILGTSSSLAWLGGVLTVTPNPMTFWAISDKPSNRGQLLWVKNLTAPPNFITPLLGPLDPLTRVWCLTYIETMEWIGYSVDTGDQLWGPVKGAQRDFTYYGSGRGGGQIGFCAYGNLYTQGFGGEIVCFDMKTGKVLWNYNNTNSGEETVWGNYPTFVSAIADGKVYAFNNEHSPNYPLYKGERVRCIDAYTGKELWTLLGWAGQAGGPGTSTSILADGFLTYYNYYDNQLWCVGKGPSETTVMVQDDSIALGEGILVKGTVVDDSAGAKRKVATGEFTSVPAVADESMGPWMEYIYMQKPIPATVKGVTVTLTAIDPNGNSQDIGSVETDMNGMFKKMWTPAIQGEYTIVATFGGTNSYWPSYSETAIGVGPARPAASVLPVTTPTPVTTPPATTPPPVTQPPPTSPSPPPASPPAETPNTAVYIAVAAVVIILVVVAVAVILRRRK
ncbi:MAG: PQQ-binding-like beta-propeller repeat protein [Candidatus Bathyarchaeia archaeon]